VNLFCYRIEIDQIRGTSWIRFFFQSFRIFHIRFALFICILSYVLLGNYINTQQVSTQVENIYYKHALGNIILYNHGVAEWTVYSVAMVT